MADILDKTHDIVNLIKQKLHGSTEAMYQGKSEDLIGALSNQGSSNPLKGPTPRTLFYEGGFYHKDDAKYGQFLFYTLGKSGNKINLDEYYKSERSVHNAGISSKISRNPTAGALIKDTHLNLAALTGFESGTDNSSNIGSGNNGNIIGGASAPYHWKDFLYCKYYGSIPNNYMVTLRRYPAPMRDNLSIPTSLQQSELYKKQGAGRPVAQAVTWWGGGTGNSLNAIIGFTAGLKWDPVTQDDVKYQEGLDQGFFKSVLGRAFAGAASKAGVGDLLAKLGDVGNLIIASTIGGKDEVTIPKINYALRDKMIAGGGPLSDFIFTSVDTIDKTWIRGRGLTFGEIDLALKFHYELTSVGEVNTKMALIDILGNLLGIGTNYGMFLTPDIRYNNSFPAIGFPGGDEGLMEFYSDPLKWMKTAIKFLADPSGSTMSGTEGSQFKETVDSIDKLSKSLQSGLEQLSKADIDKLVSGDGLNSSVSNMLMFALADDLIGNIQVPLGLKTGAPIGEWHLVVGNPMNPVAMIGNLICSSVNIEFGEVLGPDDFPTELVATFNLKHGRDRERGEIESMFNRGDGRLYQSTLETSANNQSRNMLALITGDLVNMNENATNTTDYMSNTFSDKAAEVTKTIKD